MREVKFKGKTLDCKLNEPNSTWLFGQYIIIGKKHLIIEPSSNIRITGIYGKADSFGEISQYGSTFPVEVQPKSVGEFTGRLDGRGTEIYGGDFVMSKGHLQAKTKEGKPEQGLIVYDEKMAAFCFQTHDGRSYFLCEMKKPLLVIGNVTDCKTLITPKI